MPLPSRGARRRLAAALIVLAAACSPEGPGLVDPSVSLNKGRKPGGETPPPPPPAGVCDADTGPGELAGLGWTSVFAEEFSEAGFGQWNLWHGGAWNEELQLYKPENARQAGSSLFIEAKTETVVGPANPYDPTLKTYEFTSARLETRNHFGASPATPSVRLSARIKLPSGYGMWPAFWSYGDPWPTQGEIDIMEARGQDPFQYQTAYWWGRREGVNQVRNSAAVINTVDLQTCFHVYEVIWTKDALTYLLDGQVVDVKSGGNIPNMFGRSQRIVLNVAVGGLFFNNLVPSQIVPGTMEVDWVRVHTLQ